MNIELIRKELENSQEKIEKVHKNRAYWETMVAKQEVAVEALKGKAFRQLSSSSKKMSDTTKKYYMYDERIMLDVETYTTVEDQARKLAEYKGKLAEAIGDQLTVKEVVENLRELLKFEMSLNYSTR